jgi:Mediator complex subunit 16
MILCSAPRFLLRHVSKMLRMALGAIRDNLKKSPDGDPAKEHWRRLNASFAGHPIYPLLYRMTALDQYFLEVEKAVRECYAAQAQAGTGSSGPARRAATERGMLFRCDLPAFLAPAVSALVRGAVGPLLAEHEGVDRGLLFKQTIALLGLSAEDARLAHGEPLVDVVRKWPMSAAKKVKRCARCGSATEDAEAQAAGAPWLASSLRHCVCFNNWIVLEEAGSKK